MISTLGFGMLAGAMALQPSASTTETLAAEDAREIEESPEASDGEQGTPGAEPEQDDLGPGESRTDDQLVVEAAALLFASADPLSSGRIRALLQRPARPRVQAALERLEERLATSGLPIVLRRIAGGWRLLTDPEYGDVIARMRKDARPERISAAALETLAIVAYRQPVTKAEVEAIRGVQVGPILRALVDRGLVRVTGRASLPGSPLQYGTTKEFLERFGLPSLKELPRDGELTES